MGVWGLPTQAQLTNKVLWRRPWQSCRFVHFGDIFHCFKSEFCHQVWKKSWVVWSLQAQDQLTNEASKLWRRPWQSCSLVWISPRLQLVWLFMGFQSVYDDILICYSIPLRDATLSKRCPKTSCKAEQLAMKSQYRVPVLVPQSTAVSSKV